MSSPQAASTTSLKHWLRKICHWWALKERPPVYSHCFDLTLAPALVKPQTIQNSTLKQWSRLVLLCKSETMKILITHKTRGKLFYTWNITGNLPLAKLNHRLENATGGSYQGAFNTLSLPELWRDGHDWRLFELRSQIPFLPYTAEIAVIIKTDKLKFMPSSLAHAPSVRLRNVVLRVSQSFFHLNIYVFVCVHVWKVYRLDKHTLWQALCHTPSHLNKCKWPQWATEKPKQSQQL